MLFSSVPPVGASYHLIEVPVAARLATVAALQKDWLAFPVGGGVPPSAKSFTVMVNCFSKKRPPASVLLMRME